MENSATDVPARSGAGDEEITITQEPSCRAIFTIGRERVDSERDLQVVRYQLLYEVTVYT